MRRGSPSTSVLRAQVADVHVEVLASRARSRSPRCARRCVAWASTTPALRTSSSSRSNSVLVSSISRSPAPAAAERRRARGRPPGLVAPRRSTLVRRRSAREARQQLVERERLHQVVVGAGVEARHPVGDLGARREHEDGDPHPRGPETPAHGEPVDVRHHHVEESRSTPVAARRRRARPRRRPRPRPRSPRARGHGSDSRTLRSSSARTRCAVAMETFLVDGCETPVRRPPGILIELLPSCPGPLTSPGQPRPCRSAPMSGRGAVPSEPPPTRSPDVGADRAHARHPSHRDARDLHRRCRRSPAAAHHHLEHGHPGRPAGPALRPSPRPAAPRSAATSRWASPSRPSSSADSSGPFLRRRGWRNAGWRAATPGSARAAGQ